MKIISLVENFFKKYSLLSSDNVILIGFSGGYDSLCLLDVLNELSEKYRFKVVAAHLNHNWRGEESLRDEYNARKFCENKNITFYSEKLDKNLPHTELEARNQRYLFFNRVAEKYGVNAILTGHTSTDNVETVLYRIIKGTGLHGLEGVPEFRPVDSYRTIYRPMLNISREETIQYCEEKNLQVSVDSSNLETKYVRNKLRLELIPELRKYNKNFDNAILQLSTIAKDYQEISKEYLNSIKSKIIKNNILNTNAFMELSLAVKKQIIILFLEENNIEYDYKKISEIVNFIDESHFSKSGKTLSLTTSMWLFVNRQEAKVITEVCADVIQSCIRVEFNKLNYHPELDKTLEIIEFKSDGRDEFPENSSNEIYADLSNIKSKLYFRARKSGDRFQPLGMSQTTKLKKFFINKGIPQHKRNLIPILSTEEEVLWIAGVALSEKIRVKDKPTHVIKVF